MVLYHHRLRPVDLRLARFETVQALASLTPQVSEKVVAVTKRFSVIGSGMILNIVRSPALHASSSLLSS